MMKKAVDFFKKYWVFILLAAIVAILLVIRFSQKRVALPSPQPTPSPIFGSLPQPRSGFTEILSKESTYKILFSQSDFAKFPQILPVYKIKKFTKDEITSQFTKVISGLGFSGTPEETQRRDDLYLIWREGENYLSVNSSSGQFSFNGKVSLVENQTLTSTQIQELVRQKLSFWGLIESETAISEIKGFEIAGLELVPVKNLESANVFRITLNPDLDSYPLVGLGPAKNLIEAKIDNKGVLISLFFNLHQVNKEIVGDYPIKSFEETTRDLKDGKAQIILVLTSEGEDRSIPPKDQIQEVQISSLEVVYYETVESQDFYQPVLLLKGKIILKNKEEYQALFILSAITEKYLAP